MLPRGPGGSRGLSGVCGPSGPPLGGAGIRGWAALPGLRTARGSAVVAGGFGLIGRGVASGVVTGLVGEVDGHEWLLMRGTRGRLGGSRAGPHERTAGAGDCSRDCGSGALPARGQSATGVRLLAGWPEILKRRRQVSRTDDLT